MNSVTRTFQLQTQGMCSYPTAIYTKCMQSVTLLTFHLPGAMRHTFLPN